MRRVFWDGGALMSTNKYRKVKSQINIEDINDLKTAFAQLQKDLFNLSIYNLKFDLSIKLAKWLHTWINYYLPSEKDFAYNSLMRYERGMVVFADLGFKVGSEEGGKHFALVIENNNNITNKTITVIPLKSLELNESLLEIDEQHEIFLGYAIFEKEIQKNKNKIAIKQQLLSTQTINSDSYNRTFKELATLQKRLDNYNKGSVVLVNQICALSKIRIIFPKHNNDTLSDFKLNSAKLNEIDKLIKKMYLKKSTFEKAFNYTMEIFQKNKLHINR